MRRAFLGLLVGGALLLAGAVGAVWLAVDDLPRVDPGRSVTAADASRARQLLLAADPRRQPEGAVQRLRLSDADVSLLLDDGSRRLLGGAARVAVREGQARLEISAPVDGLARRLPALRPLRRVGAWLNLQAQWQASAEGLPQLSAMRVGELPLPAGIVQWLAGQAVRHYRLDGELDLVRSLVDQLRFEPGQLTLVYRWRGELRERLRETLVPPVEQDRLRAYQEGLAERLSALGGRAEAPVPLVQLMPALFELAQRRSAAQATLPIDRGGEDPGGWQATAARENKALLLVLALYAAEQSPARLVPAARQWPAPPHRPVTLGGREDFAQHFLVSAFLAAEGGGRLADAVGVYKEVADARGGSGFSFNDLAADRAGTRFGQRAAHDAARLQQQLAAGRAGDPGLRDADLLPAVGDLPQFLTEADFRREYGHVGSPAYTRMQETIEARIRAMPLLRLGAP